MCYMLELQMKNYPLKRRRKKTFIFWYFALCLQGKAWKEEQESKEAAEREEYIKSLGDEHVPEDGQSDSVPGEAVREAV